MIKLAVADLLGGELQEILRLRVRQIPLAG